MALFQFINVVLLTGSECSYDPCDYVSARDGDQSIRATRLTLCQTSSSSCERSVCIAEGNRLLSGAGCIRLPVVQTHHEILGGSDIALEMKSVATC